MSFESNQPVTLNRESYRIERLLGSGAMALVYLAHPAVVPDADVIIKIPINKGYEEGVRREVEILKTLTEAEDPFWIQFNTLQTRLSRIGDATQRQKRLIAALLDCGETDDGQPFLVQEFAPPQFERFKLNTITDEYRLVAVGAAVAKAMALAHQHNFALKDFAPSTKSDRIRVKWLSTPDQFELKMIDWNVTGDAADFSQDLFMFGQHFHFFLLGRQVIFDSAGLPPRNLDSGGGHWSRLTEGSRLILQQLLHRDMAKRYRNAQDIADDLHWWAETLQQVKDSRSIETVESRYQQNRAKRRYDRNLALARLALSFNPPADKVLVYQKWVDEARNELEKAIRLPIAHLRSDLLIGSYRTAAEGFAQQLQALPKEGEAARLVRIYMYQSQLGIQLKEMLSSTDIRPTEAWQEVTQSVSALIEKDWGQANRHLSALISILPSIGESDTLKTMRQWVQGGMLVQQANRDIERTEFLPGAVKKPGWLEEEADLITQAEKATRNLQKSCELAPFEYDFVDRFQAAEAALEDRKNLLAQYREIDRFVQLGQAKLMQGEQTQQNGDFASAKKELEEANQAFSNAADSIKQIMAVNNLDPYARFQQGNLMPLIEQTQVGIEKYGEFARRMAESRHLCNQGLYDAAATMLEALPEDGAVNFIRDEISLGKKVEEDIRESLVDLRNRLRRRKPFNGLPEELLQKDRVVFRLLGGSLGTGALNLQDQVFHLSQILRDDITAVARERATLKTLRHEIETNLKDLKDGDFDLVLVELGELDEKFGPLTNDELKWQKQAQDKNLILDEQEKQLTQPVNEQILKEIKIALEGIPGKRAERLRRQWQEKNLDWQAGQKSVIISGKLERFLYEDKGQIHKRKLNQLQFTRIGLWDGEKLPLVWREVTGEDRFPPELQDRLYRIPPDLRDDLAEVIRIYQQVEQTCRLIDISEQTGDYPNLIKELENLAGISPLTDAESDLRIRALACLDTLDRLEKELPIQDEAQAQRIDDAIRDLNLRGPRKDALQKRVSDYRNQKTKTYETGRLHQVVENYLGQIEPDINQRINLPLIETNLKNYISWSNKPLGDLPGGERLSPEAQSILFSYDLGLYAKLKAALYCLDLLQTKQMEIDAARKAGDHIEVITLVNQLEQDPDFAGRSLTPTELAWREEAQNRRDTLAQIKAKTADISLNLADWTIDLAMEVQTTLAGDPNPDACNLRETAVRWLQGQITFFEEKTRKLVQEEIIQVFGRVQELLKEGDYHEAGKVLEKIESYHQSPLKDLAVDNPDRQILQTSTAVFTIPAPLSEPLKPLKKRQKLLSEIDPQIQSLQRNGDWAKLGQLLKDTFPKSFMAQSDPFAFEQGQKPLNYEQKLFNTAQTELEEKLTNMECALGALNFEEALTSPTEFARRRSEYTALQTDWAAFPALTSCCGKLADDFFHLAQKKLQDKLTALESELAWLDLEEKLADPAEFARCLQKYTTPAGWKTTFPELRGHCETIVKNFFDEARFVIQKEEKCIWDEFAGFAPPLPKKGLLKNAPLDKVAERLDSLITNNQALAGYTQPAFEPAVLEAWQSLVEKLQAFANDLSLKDLPELDKALKTFQTNTLPQISGDNALDPTDGLAQLMAEADICAGLLKTLQQAQADVEKRPVRALKELVKNVNQLEAAAQARDCSLWAVLDLPEGKDKKPLDFWLLQQAVAPMAKKFKDVIAEKWKPAMKEFLLKLPEALWQKEIEKIFPELDLWSWAYRILIESYDEATAEKNDLKLFERDVRPAIVKDFSRRLQDQIKNPNAVEEINFLLCDFSSVHSGILPSEEAVMRMEALQQAINQCHGPGNEEIFRQAYEKAGFAEPFPGNKAAPKQKQRRWGLF